MDLYNDMIALLPHRPPMVLADKVVSATEDSAVTVRTFADGAYGTDEGRVSEPTLIEALAQTVAALHGIAAVRRNLRPGAGMLVAVNDLHFHSCAVTGAEVEFSAAITWRMPPFCFADMKAVQDGRLVAEGTMKFYIEEGQP